ncbi:hypothetical protein NHX12_009579 [Muraenolepis orangiensis]|uniref:USP domain-containing protein n=1 Tax=Muraenolepis orangiensis TaxID=630683 RepID=A0A9Q0DKK7_9TELE|nr:hypothetical protein NHX12_009579 [Muraenolepis orangiensis]
MVMFSKWQRTAMDQMRNGGLPMTSEDTGLGALTPTLAGYLGKVQERVSSLDNCPWCSSKGQVYALRSYRINFQESISLCTNPQCLFPLVSQPLEDIFAELLPAKEQIGGKRKNGHVLQSEDVAVPPAKRLRSNKDEEPKDAAAEEEPPAIDVDCAAFTVLQEIREKAPRSPLHVVVTSEAMWQGEGAEDKSDYALVPTRSPSKPMTGDTVLASAAPPASRHASAVKDQTIEDALIISSEDVLCRQANGLLRDGLEPHNLDSNQCGIPVGTDVAFFLMEGTTNEVKPEPLSPTLERADSKYNVENVPPPLMEAASLKASEELVSLPPRLFWGNRDNLCWLDSLLVALVNCKSLRDLGTRDRPQKSPVWELIGKYDDICAAVEAHQSTGPDGIVRVPDRVLQKAYSDMQNIRTSMFHLLQPKLQCHLGRRETPVFALPVLVASDSWAASLFEHTFHWDFEVTKPLPTFTSLVPDWHPEKAVHLSPCNACNQKKQRRTMVLDRVPPVFALHFVEGLPGDDLQTYSFSSYGSRYSVSTVIQYNQTIKHFVTWIRTSNGLWQEFDDLKHPGCNSHAKLPVPAHEIHIVLWEMEPKDPTHPTCSPPTTVGESLLSGMTPNHATALAQSPDRSLLPLHDYSHIGGATKEAKASVELDVSIGSTTLLDAFEGLSHSDFITLTLVEVDLEGKPLAGINQTPETGSADTYDGMSDSMHQETPDEVWSDPDCPDHLSSDPTFVPGSGKQKRQARVKAKSSDGDNKSVQRKAKAVPSRRAPAKRSKKAVLDTTAVAEETPPEPSTRPAAATVSSSDTAPSPQSSQKNPGLPLVPLQRDRWSSLLTRHSQTQAKGTHAPLSSPVTPVIPPAVALAKTPVQCTPKPAERPKTPLFFKPRLRMESGELPPKLASMYEAFGVNGNTTILSSSPSQALPWQGTPPVPRETPAKTKAVPGALLSPRATVLDGLSNTCVLRLKLMKVLKAKKKKLEKLNQLNQLLKGGAGAEANPRPDSTERRSPQAVTSSTTGSTCDDFFSSLCVSPASTVSNLSPDSSGLLEMLANVREAGDQLDHRLNPMGGSSQVNYSPHCSLTGNNEDSLEEFISRVAAQQRIETESQALSELDLFF